MIWKELYFDKEFKKEELITAIAKAFNVQEEDVLITSNIGKFVDPNVRKKILCESYHLNQIQEFKLLLTFAIDDTLNVKNDIEIFSKLIAILECKLMVDNYSEVPGAMLIMGGADIKMDELEDIEEFELCR